jgi:hypothetical protein
MPVIEAIARAEFDAAELVRLHPPRFTNPRKQMLFERIHVPVTGSLAVSRWRGDLPETVASPRRPVFEMRYGIFSYRLVDAGTKAWHLNFADAQLFGYYGGPLLAQDEHQVLEHPVLGSLREALLEMSMSRPELAPRTREGGPNANPTPYLISNVQRSLYFDTVAGPYGNAFAASNPGRVLDAATFLSPPTFSNILAMAAPPGGIGRYTRADLTDILQTAFVGFTACKHESAAYKAVVNTGNWGCGAFGGNPVLMALLQLCASTLAGIDRLIYHTSPTLGDSYRQALGLLDELVAGPEIDTRDLIDCIEALGFEWGTSDGN